MRRPVILITGANGEIGHGLVDHFRGRDEHHIVALDLKSFDPKLTEVCEDTIVGDILDEDLLQRLVSEYEIHEIYHLAALLSTRSEYSPMQAHRVNVNGTLNLLQLAQEQAQWHGHTVKFLFPSSIAAYGLPDRRTKNRVGAVSEQDYNFPSTIYGCNKLYCEQIGRYFSENFRQLAADPAPSGVDFRALRFPGLISAFTVPSGGTSDYAPEIVHAAASGESYACFVDAETRLPFMAMPDAIKSLVHLAAAPVEQLAQRVYNISAFAVTAGEVRDRALASFPDAEITFQPDVQRARIVDTWPAELDDTAARRDWGWNPDYDFTHAFDDYLMPNIVKRYEQRQ